MKHLDKTVCLLIALLAMSIPVIAQTAATVPEAETPVYEDIFASLAAIVAGVPVIVEAIRGFWKDMPGWAVWHSTGCWVSESVCSAGGRN